MNDKLEQDRQAVRRDRWDLADWNRTREDVPTLKKLEQSLEDVSWTAPRVLPDLHQLLARPAPKLTDPKDLQPAFRPNRRIAEELQGLEVVDQMRHHTVGDAMTAGMAASKMQDDLVTLYEQLAEAQDAADQAQDAEDQYQGGCAGAGVAPGSPEAQADAALEALRQHAEAAQAAADAALDGMAPVIGQQVQRAAEAGQETAEDAAAAVGGWGLDKGEMAMMDPAARLALMERLMDPRMQKIAALFGRMRQELWAAASPRWDQGPDEIADVTLGSDLNRLVTSELIGLCDPDLEVDFLDRYDRGHLMQYELRQRAKEARGSIVYVADYSASMADGVRDIFAVAFGLVLLDVAARQGRGFRVVAFAGSGQIQEFDFGRDASKSSIEERLAYASFTMSGGTEYEGPLGRAIGCLLEEKEATGRISGDVVLVTDDECRVTEEWLAKWDEQRRELGFRCFGVSVMAVVPPVSTLRQVADQVTSVYQLTSGKEVAKVFEAATEPAELVL